MKTAKILSVLAFALVVMLSSCSPDSTNEDSIDVNIKENSYVPQANEFEILVLELINEHRISLGLNALQNMSVIKAQAYGHTDYMIEKNQVSHDNFYLRAKNLKAEADAVAVGENVAYGYNSPEALVNAWLNSEGHKVVIEGNYTHFDISAEKNENDRWYFTNIFIRK